MKDLCKLVDGTVFEVEDVTLWDINTYCKTEEEAVALCEKINPENTSVIEFYTQYEDGTENELIMRYEDVSMLTLPSRTTMGERQILVHASCSVPDAVQEAVETNKTDITDIQMALVEIYEMLESLMG